MSSKLKPEVHPPIDILRSLLNIQKCPITLSTLLKEYREIEGKNLPFKSLGFKSAEEYLKSSGEFLIINDRGEVYISARPKKDSFHIIDMIANQKIAKKRTRRSFGNQNNRMPSKTDQSWNKSSYSSNVYRNLPSAKSTNDSRNRRRGNDKGKRNSVNQRIGDSNNNTSSSSNRNVSDDNINISKPIKQISNEHSSKPQPLMANLVPKPDLHERINFNKQQPNQVSPKSQKAQPLPKEKQQLQKQNQQNNINKKNDANQKDHQSHHHNGQPVQNKNEKQPQQKQTGVQSKSNNLTTLQNRLMNVRNTKKNNLDDEKIKDKDSNKKISNNELQKQQVTPATITKNLQTPTSSIRPFSMSIQDRLKINKLQNNSVNEMNYELITPPTSPLTEYSEKSNSFLNNSRQSSQDSLQNFANYTNTEKSAVINNKINKTKKILAPTESYEFDTTLNSIVSLMNYCTARGFPTPKFHLMRPKFFNKKVLCSVVINGKTYTTIPKYFNDPEIAKAACAAIAIEEIKITESKVVSYPVCTDSKSDLILKIYQEIKTNHTINGIFLNGLPKLFESKFQQTLPDNWLSLIENSKFFVIESTSDKNKILLANLNISETDSLPSDQDDIVIDPLELPWDSKYWNLYITHCASTIEVWARIVDKEYSQQLDSLLNDIDLEMLTDKTRPGSLTTGQMYLVCISECWHRVRLERMDKAVGKCLCFFIDFGDDDWLAMDQLFVCDKKFLKLPPQAVPFSLFGLEDFAENPVANQHLNEMIMGKTLVAQIFTKKEIYEAKNVSTTSSVSSSLDSLNDIIKIQAVLYDTSSNVDVVLNPLLINKICDDTSAPELKQNSPTNVNITHITDEGDIYLQVLDSGLFYVQKLISQLVESKFQQDQYKINSTEMKSSNLYLIYDQDDNKWYRGCLVENDEYNSRAQEFKIFYVDFGLTKEINISNIFRLESLSAALSRYPKQALKAKMHNLPPLNQFLLQRLKALLPKDSLAIVKLAFNKLDISRNVVPQITVFIRIERNQSLCNVNDAIRMEYELISNDFPADLKIITNNDTSNSICSSPTSLQPKMIPELSPSNRNYSVRSPITVPSTPVKGSLPQLNTNVYFPEKGEIFNVLVTIASNPFNFFVRPYNDFIQYQNMMTELQNYCQDNDEFIPDDMVKAGESYAVLLDDGFYYRCIIEIALPNQMCVVFFCDCGDRNVVEINALRTLPAKCRELATQAIQAKLHGVKPLTGEWTLEDSIRFSDLTVGQKFATVVQNISIDDFDPNKTSKVLELTLIDVTTSQDIYIHDILIEENRATLIT